MTVLPVSAMRSAPAGTVTPAAGPAATMRPSRTTIVALSIGARSVPSISREPGERLGGAAGGRLLGARRRRAAAVARARRGGKQMELFMGNNI